MSGSALSTRLRIATLVLAAVLTVSYLGFATWFRDKVETEAVEFRENMLWAVFQVQKELLTTLRAADQAQAGHEAGPDTAELTLALDLLVSRVALIRNGEGFAELRRIESFRATLAELDGAVAEIDAALTALAEPRSAGAVADILLTGLGPFEPRIQRTSLDAVHYATQRNTMRSNEISTMLNWMQALFLINLLIIAGALFLAFRQTLRAAEQRRERRYLEETAERSKLQALGTLAGGVAHEINTPAQFITSNLDFLREGFRELQDPDLPADERDYLEAEIPAALQQSADGIRRIADIVRAIKHFSHPETVGVQPIDVAAEIRTAVLLTGNKTKDVAIVETTVADDLPAVHGSGNALDQVLINLIVNAAQAIEGAVQPPRSAGSPPPRIRISASAGDGGVRIAVEDDGPGIPDVILPRIFDPFFTTKAVDVGSGQGLAISERIVTTVFGGRIRAANRPGGGARFEIDIPASAAVAPASPPVAAG
jgi:signal transduction histidine kinase